MGHQSENRPWKLVVIRSNRIRGMNPARQYALLPFYRRSPIGRDNGLKIRPVWVRVPSAVFVPVA